MEKLYTDLASSLGVDDIQPDEPLADLPEWDSLGVLSAIAMIHTGYGVSLSAADMKHVDTAVSLLALIERKLGS